VVVIHDEGFLLTTDRTASALGDEERVVLGLREAVLHEPRAEHGAHAMVVRETPRAALIWRRLSPSAFIARALVTVSGLS
jgi:hypothetical protein